MVAHHQRQHERLPLDQLAKEFHVHVRTLQAPSEPVGWRRTSPCSPCLVGPGDWRRAPPSSSSWPRTTADSAGKRSVRLPSQRSPPTTTSTCGRSVVGSGSHKTAWHDASARLERPSSISGNRGSEPPHLYSGSASSNSSKSGAC
jgi:hypothetical protein